MAILHLLKLRDLKANGIGEVSFISILRFVFHPQIDEPLSLLRVIFKGTCWSARPLGCLLGVDLPTVQLPWRIGGGFGQIGKKFQNRHLTDFCR